MSQYDLMLHLRINVGLCELYFKVCRGVYSFRLVRPSMHSFFTVTSISWSSDFAIHLEDGLMYENDSLGKCVSIAQPFTS